MLWLTPSTQLRNPVGSMPNRCSVPEMQFWQLSPSWPLLLLVIYLLLLLLPPPFLPLPLPLPPSSALLLLLLLLLLMLLLLLPLLPQPPLLPSLMRQQDTKGNGGDC